MTSLVIKLKNGRSGAAPHRPQFGHIDPDYAKSVCEILPNKSNFWPLSQRYKLLWTNWSLFLLLRCVLLQMKKNARPLAHEWSANQPGPTRKLSWHLLSNRTKIMSQLFFLYRYAAVMFK